MTGDPVQHVAAQLGVGRPMISRWRQRFAEAGVDRLLRDKAKALEAAVKRYLVEYNAEPKPFVWTASAVSILAKLGRLPAPSE